MASVRRHPRSRFWYACITGPDGKQRQFSTGLEDREEALAAAVAAERALRKLHSEPHKLRTALERLADDYTPKADKDPAAWLLAWSESRRGECAAKTLVAYQTVAKEAAEWLSGAKVESFAAFTQSRVLELRSWWVSRNSARTANGKIKVLRVALNVAVTEKLLATNPAVGLIPLKEKKTPRREFRAAEMEVLKPALSGEWKALFYLGLNTGQRLNDLAVLQWRQVDVAQKTVTFVTAKTARLCCLPLLTGTISALTELESSDDPNAFVFPKLASVKPQARSNQFREILASVGLAEPVSHKKKETPSPVKTSELSFHSLRHTTGSLLKAAGVSEGIAKSILGHSTQAISDHYTHIDLATMREAMERMSG